MIQLCIFLSLFAKLTNAGFNVSLGEMTLSDRTDLTCCHTDQVMCFFYADSRNIGQQNSSDNCCKLTVSGEQLLAGKAREELRTTITIQCKADYKMIQNVTIAVWRISLSGKYTLIFLVILGSLILLSLLISIIICIIYMTKKQGYRQKFKSSSYRTQVMDTDSQDANSDTAEVQEEKTERVEDELLYATVNHSGAGENSALAVKFESGTDYATVVIH